MLLAAAVWLSHLGDRSGFSWLIPISISVHVLGTVKTGPLMPAATIPGNGASVAVENHAVFENIS